MADNLRLRNHIGSLRGLKGEENIGWRWCGVLLKEESGCTSNTTILHSKSIYYKMALNKHKLQSWNYPSCHMFPSFYAIGGLSIVSKRAQHKHLSWAIHHNHHYYYHHHISVMELGQLLTRSGLTYPEVSSKFYHDSFCPLRSNVSLPWVIYFEAFYLHVVSSLSCIPWICPKLVLFSTPL